MKNFLLKDSNYAILILRSSFRNHLMYMKLKSILVYLRFAMRLMIQMRLPI